MAKAAKYRKRRARTKSTKKASKALVKTIIGGLFFLIIFVFTTNDIFSKAKPQIAQSVPTPTIFPTPTVIPSPTSAPSPTSPPKPAGFCLNVPVLFYHHIQPQSQAAAKGQTSLSVDNGIFDQQMAYLVSHGYQSITVKQLADALVTHSGLSAKSIAITFDDGYRDNFDYAKPVLSKYGLTGNLMLATGLTGGSDYLTWDDVVQMKNSGWYITDHTWSHYSVNKGPADKIKFEIETARQQIQDHTGQPSNIFTYPYGSFGNTAINILKQDGFEAAFTTNPGTYQCDSFIMTLHRTRIGNAPLSSYGF